jgi:GDP-L-fucose synthase
MHRQKIYIAGHRGMVGSAILRALTKQGHSNFILRTRNELDLTDSNAVKQFFETERPDQVYLAAAKVGGIQANNILPAEFIYENLMIQCNVIHCAWKTGVKKLLFLGSSCIYPKFSEQPISESSLLTGILEPTNEPYAIAKIAGIKMCESYNRQYGNSDGIDYRCVMPTNLYGAGDNYHQENSHVVPALIRRFHDAKVTNAPTVSIWGTGTPRREFLYVDDMAEASVHIMNLPLPIYQIHVAPMQSHINVGAGEDISILELAQLIADVIGYQGIISCDTSKPDGTPRKLMDNSLIKALGWSAKMPLKNGLALTYQDFLNNNETLRKF